MLQTVRKAMKDLQGRFAAAVASQVGGPEVTYLVCGHAMLVDVKHYCGARRVSAPLLFGIMPDAKSPFVALQRSSQAAVGSLKAELQHQARILQGTLGAQQASQTKVSRNACNTAAVWASRLRPAALCTSRLRINRSAGMFSSSNQAVCGCFSILLVRPC